MAKRSVQEEWDSQAVRWSKYGADSANKFSLRSRFVCELVRRHVPAGGTTLDVGCASGVLCEELTRAGFRVCATDISPAMVRASQQRLTDLGWPNVEFSVAQDVRTAFAGRYFDLVAAIGVFPYVNDYDAYLTELSAVLKPGGFIAASCTNRVSLYAMATVLNRLGRLPPHLRTIRNVLRTGLPSGGHVDLSISRQLYSAGRFDGLFRSRGFALVDGFDWYHISLLDRSPLDRGRCGKKLARFLGWTHVGLYARCAGK